MAAVRTSGSLNSGRAVPSAKHGRRSHHDTSLLPFDHTTRQGRVVRRRSFLSGVKLRRLPPPGPCCCLTTAALGPGGTFVDDNGNLHEPNIEAIFAAGITTGCSVSPSLFCPNSGSHPRTDGGFPDAGPASFLLPDRDYFTDDAGSIFEDQINRLATAGITGGCNVGIFCPNDTSSPGSKWPPSW